MRAFLILFLHLLVASAYAQDADRSYISSDFWRQFDWAAADQSPLWRDTTFRPYDSGSTRNDPEDRYYANQKVNIAGRVYVATLAESLRKLINKEFTTLSTPVATRSDCDSLSAFWQEALKEKNIFGDNSYNAIPNFLMASLVWQWDVGGTRITANCEGIGKPAGQFDYFHLRFEALTDGNKLLAPIALQCTRTYVLTNDKAGTRNTAQPLMFSVIPLQKIIVSIDRLRIGTVESITGSSIDVVVAVDRVISSYTIDRVTGLLTGQARDKNDGLTVARYEGKCERRKSDEVKF